MGELYRSFFSYVSLHSSKADGCCGFLNPFTDCHRGGVCNSSFLALIEAVCWPNVFDVEHLVFLLAEERGVLIQF